MLEITLVGEVEGKRSGDKNNKEKVVIPIGGETERAGDDHANTNRQLSCKTVRQNIHPT